MKRRSDEIELHGGGSPTGPENRRNDSPVGGQDEADPKHGSNPADLDDHADIAAKLDVNPDGGDVTG